MQTVLEMHDVPVVGTEWLHACMRVKLRVPFNQYFTPALKDCTLSFTNLAKRARTRYQKDIEQLGGSVAPDMSRKCSHLVVGDASKPSSKLRWDLWQCASGILSFRYMHLLHVSRVQGSA